MAVDSFQRQHGRPNGGARCSWRRSWPALTPFRRPRPRLLSGAPQALRALRLKDHLPPPPPLQVRRYQPNEDSRTWLAQVIWGLVYERNAGWANPGWGGVGDELFDARAVRLVQIMQVVPEEED